MVRKDTDADSETQLLEANKKRLLRQQDWAGIAPSRPVEMQPPSLTGKNRIGKRRKIDAKTAAFTRCRSPTMLLHPTGQGEHCGPDHTFMSGALPVLAAADNVQIRIGSAALTAAASTQPGNDARSQTKSDPMLFGEEGEDATQVLQSDTPQSLPFASHAHAADQEFEVSSPLKCDRSYSHEQGSYTHNHFAQGPNNHAAERSQLHTARLNVLDQSSYESEATDPSYRLTYLVGGVERPLKLVFDKPRPSMAPHAASATYRTGELQHVHADLAAGEIQTGRVSRAVGEPAQLGVGREPSIGDEEPWRLYSDTGISRSSHVHVDAGTGTSIPRPHIPARNTQADRTGWPQQTAQGDLTHVNLSKVSASLRADSQRVGRVPDARRLSGPSVAKNINNDDALWQSFVLGSDPQSPIETIHARKETSEDSVSRATKGYASTRLPLSNAVTSVSSTPFPSTPLKGLSEQPSCISDDAQYAPQSGTRSITSMASYGMWGRVNSPSKEEVQGEDQGYETSARSRFDDQSTHASLQNHASHDSAMVSDTRTSRGESDRRGRAWDNVSRCAQASGSVVSQRDGGSSTWDIADSD